jgi:hypothetical protein
MPVPGPDNLSVPDPDNDNLSVPDPDNLLSNS